MTELSIINSDAQGISTVFKKYLDTINNLDSVWEGTSKDNAISKANEFALEYQPALEKQMSSLSNAASLAKQYVEKKQALLTCQNSLNQATDETAKTGYQLEINKLMEELTKLKKVIEESLIEAESLKIDTTLYTSENIIGILNATTEARKLGEKENLADFYEPGYFENGINKIKKNYKGREASINIALFLIKSAADKGVRLDYDFGGAHAGDGTAVTVSEVLAGVDCSTFVSFLLNEGSNKTITDMTTSTLKSNYSKYEINYSDAQAGDIINVNKNGKGHVEMIIENNPEEGYFITAEANSSSAGIKLSKTSYKECEKQGQKAYNMDVVYDN